MAVTLTVSQVRDALYRESGFSAGDGPQSSASVGTLFHRVLAGLLQADSPTRLWSVVASVDRDLAVWKSTLRKLAYDELLGPLLTQQAASLANRGAQVLDLWRAVQSACDWLADVWWKITDEGNRNVDGKEWCDSELSLLCELRRPNWTEPVVLIGQADALLRIPPTRHACLLEWKLGQCSPAVDLGQACLYHLMLHGESGSRCDTALAIVRFNPELGETLYAAGQLVDVQAKLIDLVGRLAGVVRTESPAVDSRPSAAPMVSTPAAVIDTAKPVTSQSVAPESVTPVPVTVASAVPQQPASPELEAWLAERRQQLTRVLKQFGAACRECRPPVVGPTFIRFSVFPEKGVTNKKILSQADQLHLHLSLSAPPTMSVVEGAIGIDLPRPDRQDIRFSAVLPILPSSDPLLGCSKIPIGVDLSQKWHWCDLGGPESAHVLVVGTPGGGKSQWLRVAVGSLMKTNTPETLQLLLIDPKQVTFGFCRNSPFLKQPIIIPGDDVPTSEILSSFCDEMDRRCGLMSTSNSQSIAEHVKVTGKKVPRLVIVCDEYADLIHGAERAEKQAIEHYFKRLTQKGRAAGVHLIVATQHPRANVLSTGIRSQLPAKVALRVTDGRESTLALDEGGAERLLGNGDLLYKCLGSPVRLQSAWLPTEEEPLVSAVNGAVA